MTNSIQRTLQQIDTRFTALRQQLAQHRRQYDNFTIPKPQKIEPRHLEPGWLLSYLFIIESSCYGRWMYWENCCFQGGELPSEPLPKIDFLTHPHPTTLKMLSRCLDCIPQSGSWQGWSSWNYFNYFLDWLLFGFGHPGFDQEPDEPQGCVGASMRLYQTFCLDMMILFPYDYWGDLFADNNYGKRQGFYPTPMPVAAMMSQMLFVNENQDNRLASFGDPCTGTGRFPLLASNYTLKLTCQDIDSTLLKATLVNGFMYAPWLSVPIPWFDEGAVIWGNALTLEEKDTLTTPYHAIAFLQTLLNQKPPKPPTFDPESESVQRFTTLQKHKSEDLSQSANTTAAQLYLFDTEFDEKESAKLAPVLKRNKKKTTISSQNTGQQLSLFD